MRQMLLAETNYFCPICGCDFHVKKGNRDSISAEAAHIYPLNPSFDDLIALDGIEPPEEVNEEGNFVMLCPTCHDRFDKPRTRDEYLMLKQTKERLSSKRLLTSLHSRFSLEDEIREIVYRLSECSFEDKGPLSLKALKVRQKLLPDFSRLDAQSIENDVTAYYLSIHQLFFTVDQSKPGTSKCVASEVNSFYNKTVQMLGADRQIEIYEAVVDWIMAKTRNLYSKRACQIITAYFIQDCDVFENVSK